VRLRLGGIAVVSMLLAIGVMTGVRAITGEPVTVILMAAVLSMVSNLAVNEPGLARLRATTALMAPPALVAVTAGTLLAPYRIVADVVFVVVMIAAVWVRRYGPRGNALGMAAMMGYFFTQFLNATVAQIPSLLLAVVVGVGATLSLRGWVFREDPERTVERLVRAFRAHLHALVEAVAQVLDAEPAERDGALRDVARRRTRLNETALLLADRLEQVREPQDAPGPFELDLIDAELAAERLSVAARRLVTDEEPPAEAVRRPLLAGLRSLGSATATGTAPGLVPALLDGAQRSVAVLVSETDGLGDRAQRVAFAVSRLADALGSDHLDPGGSHLDGGDSVVDGPPADTPAEPDTTDTPEPAAIRPAGLNQSTRQAVQVGVATSLAIVVGELVSPARWYWAVIAAFVVFAGTTSRGDLLSRGSQRVIGTIGGVLAGMGLALVVGDRAIPALILMFGCVFFALYLVRVSQALMAFWITAVLALLYGLIGQFSVETLLVRVEETAVGAAMGMLAGYLILPKGTREAFGEALDTVVDAVDATLAAAVDRILGRTPTGMPLELARDMDDALGVLRLRAKPLDNPLPRRRGRSSYQRALRVLSAVDHYARRLARLADATRDESWAGTLDPATDRIRANLDALREVLHHREPDTAGGGARSAEDEVDAAEAHAARTTDHRRRAELLMAIRMLRRIDQAVVGFATDLGTVRPDGGLDSTTQATSQR
jgi:uncharacterized membrane protein YgaE (UPF0421/DUF939 family)